jgi:plasmid segregation protein ParM
MIISIDHGNKSVKLFPSGRIFTSGLAERENRPPVGEDVLQYKGRYYILSEQRIPFLRDKSSDNRFYILTLIGIAYEIEAAGAYSRDDIIDVQLLIGLPPAHFGTLYEKFERYFAREQVEEFIFRGKPYSIYISEAVCFPQAYAAAMPVYNQIKSANKAVIIDLGGFTADYLVIKNGAPDLSACDSLESGVIKLYNRIKSKVSSDFDLLLDESDIDAILKNGSAEYDEKARRVVYETARTFVSDLFGNLRERMIDLKTGKTIFVGGGSILLKKQILASGKVENPLFVEEIAANARGYELLYRASKAGR